MQKNASGGGLYTRKDLKSDEAELIASNCVATISYILKLFMVSPLFPALEGVVAKTFIAVVSKRKVGSVVLRMWNTTFTTNKIYTIQRFYGRFCRFKQILKCFLVFRVERFLG